LEYLLIIIVAVITVVMVYNWAISSEGTLEETGERGLSQISSESAACSTASDCVPGTCQKNPQCENDICVFDTITACADGDNCCADGCNANNDNDCDPDCGNNVIEARETCDGADPASPCPGLCTPAGQPNQCKCPTPPECNRVLGPGEPNAIVECDGDPSNPSDVSREDARCGTLVCDFDSCNCVLPPGCNGVWDETEDQGLGFECDGDQDDADDICGTGYYCDMADCKCIDACDNEAWNEYDTRASIQCDGPPTAQGQLDANAICGVAGQVCDMATCTCVAGGSGCNGVLDPDEPNLVIECDGPNPEEAKASCLDEQLCGSDCICGPVISIIPSSQSVGMGETVTITVHIKNVYFEAVTAGAGYEISVSYDGSILGVSSVDKGSFFGGSWVPPVLNPNLIEQAGEWKRAGEADVSGSGDLFSVTFTTTGTGTSQIRLTDITLWSISPNVIRQFRVEGSATITVHA
jgi:hypothetical protein